MAHVSGPCRTLPGSEHKVPKGTMCDTHQDRAATIRMQGETDSFGAEYQDLCQECAASFQRAHKRFLAEPKYCDWCGLTSKTCRPHRDFEEGQAGRLYDVCESCRCQESTRAQDELDEYHANLSPYHY